jgi:hypothetical protein
VRKPGPKRRKARALASAASHARVGDVTSDLITRGICPDCTGGYCNCGGCQGATCALCGGTGKYAW